jgi:hypothetical protein
MTCYLLFPNLGYERQPELQALVGDHAANLEHVLSSSSVALTMGGTLGNMTRSYLSLQIYQKGCRKKPNRNKGGLKSVNVVSAASIALEE